MGASEVGDIMSLEFIGIREFEIALITFENDALKNVNINKLDNRKSKFN